MGSHGQFCNWWLYRSMATPGNRLRVLFFIPQMRDNFVIVQIRQTICIAYNEDTKIAQLIASVISDRWSHVTLEIWINWCKNRKRKGRTNLPISSCLLRTANRRPTSQTAHISIFNVNVYSELPGKSFVMLNPLAEVIANWIFWTCECSWCRIFLNSINWLNLTNSL